MRGFVLPGAGKQKHEEEKQPTPEGEKRYEMGRFGGPWWICGWVDVFVALSFVEGLETCFQPGLNFVELSRVCPARSWQAEPGRGEATQFF